MVEGWSASSCDELTENTIVMMTQQLSMLMNQSVWYKNGQWHRDDGPAVKYDDGAKSDTRIQ
jgi:hypothetical protein